MVLSSTQVTNIARIKCIYFLLHLVTIFFSMDSLSATCSCNIVSIFYKGNDLNHIKILELWSSKEVLDKYHL
jgi:hypothetical protein